MYSSKTAWLLLSPTLLILGVVGLLPFLYVLYIGFFTWNPLGVNDQMQFVSLGDNYRNLVFDTEFIASIWRSIKFAVITLFFELTLGFLLCNRAKSLATDAKSDCG